MNCAWTDIARGRVGLSVQAVPGAAHDREFQISGTPLHARRQSRARDGRTVRTFVSGSASPFCSSGVQAPRRQLSRLRRSTRGVGLSISLDRQAAKHAVEDFANRLPGLRFEGLRHAQHHGGVVVLDPEKVSPKTETSNARD